jgi:hypothetical protein
MSRRRLDDAHRRVARHGSTKSTDERVDAWIDGVPEFHRECSVSDRKDSRKQGQCASGRTATPADSRAARTARAIVAAPGVSPWMQRVSACNTTS